jgi:hypothetical protein
MQALIVTRNLCLQGNLLTIATYDDASSTDTGIELGCVLTSSAEWKAFSCL